MVGATSHVLFAALAFIGIHVLTSTPIRAALVGRLGEGWFAGVFSLLSALTLGWLIWAYNSAPTEALWEPAPWTRHLLFALVALAFVFLTFAFSGKGKAAAGDPAPGFMKVTRHPMFWGVALWAGAHIPANGDRASVYFFGAFLVLALIGMPLQDRKKWALHRATWEPIARRTSAIPFVAAIQGRSGLKWADISWWRLLLGLGLFAGFLFAHEIVIGVPVISF